MLQQDVVDDNGTGNNLTGVSQFLAPQLVKQSRESLLEQAKGVFYYYPGLL
jgi:hypothetical protein